MLRMIAGLGIQLQRNSEISGDFRIEHKEIDLLYEYE